MSTLDPTTGNKNSFATLSNGNLTVTGNSGVGAAMAVRSTTTKSTGLVQFDVTVSSAYDTGEQCRIGFVNSSHSMTSFTSPGNDANSVGLEAFGGSRDVQLLGAGFIDLAQNGPTYTGSWPYTSANGDVYSVVCDFTNSLLYIAFNGGFRQNGSGTIQNPSTPTGGWSFSGMTGPFYACIAPTRGTSFTINFTPSTLYGGASAWDTVAPTGRAQRSSATFF